jgi:hypothetical protein
VLGEQVLTYQDLAYYFNAKKNVSLTQVYLAIDNNDEVQLDKVRNRESSLEVTFGLKVQVRALREVDALLNGIALRAGVTVVATLDDKIVFHNDSELPLAISGAVRALLALAFNSRPTSPVISSPTILPCSTRMTFFSRPGPVAKCC